LGGSREPHNGGYSRFGRLSGASLVYMPPLCLPGWYPPGVYASLLPVCRGVPHEEASRDASLLPASLLADTSVSRILHIYQLYDGKRGLTRAERESPRTPYPFHCWSVIGHAGRRGISHPGMPPWYASLPYTPYMRLLYRSPCVYRRVLCPLHARCSPLMTVISVRPSLTASPVQKEASFSSGNNPSPRGNREIRAKKPATESTAAQGW